MFAFFSENMTIYTKLYRLNYRSRLNYITVFTKQKWANTTARPTPITMVLTYTPFIYSLPGTLHLRVFIWSFLMFPDLIKNGSSSRSHQITKQIVKITTYNKGHAEICAKDKEARSVDLLRCVKISREGSLYKLVYWCPPNSTRLTTWEPLKSIPVLCYIIYSLGYDPQFKRSDKWKCCTLDKTSIPISFNNSLSRACDSCMRIKDKTKSFHHSGKCNIR